MDKSYEDLRILFNTCTDCNINMTFAEHYYECPNCGLKKEIEGTVRDCDDEASSSIRLYGLNGQSFLFNPEYTKIQKKNILNQLMKLHNDKSPISKEIIYAICETYNEIQKIIIDEDNHKKFVRRGSIKDEILGALIKYECIKNGYIIKLKEICDFMKLKSTGISRGENILRELYICGKIDIPLDDDLYDIYIKKYLKGIKQYNSRYIGFVKDLLAECIKKRIGLNSIVTSKVAGAIWLLILHEELPISFQTMEAATKNIRKNTWNRYTKIVQKNILKLIDVFKKWNINHGIDGFLIRRSDLKNMPPYSYKIVEKIKYKYK